MIALLLLLLLLLLAPSALASTSRPSSSSFGIFTNPQALTVDQSSGDVFVVDATDGTVSRFDSSGTPQSFTCVTCSGNSLSGFSFDSPSAAEVAIAPAGAVGGTAGDIYVVSFAGIDVFASDGTHLGQITQANGSGFGEACGVATDNAGRLYVGDFSGKIDRYVPSANPPTNGDYDAQITGLSSPCNVAADSTGAVYASTWSTGPLTKFAASDFGTSNPGTQVDAASTAVAVDPSTDDVYVDEGNQIAVFDSTGAALYTFGSSSDFGSDSAGVAVKGSGGNAYVADRTNGEIDVFGPLVEAPTVTPGDPTAISGTSATLHAKVDPETFAVTDCHFDYGIETNLNTHAFTYANSAACTPDPGSGSGDVAVSASISGLEPGAVYHFRIEAANANFGGTADGSDQTLTTLGAQIHAETADHITTADARLGAQVNPQGNPTTYHFEYGTSTSYSSATSEISIGSGSADVPVSKPISALAPQTTYHFRVVATNAEGVSHGPDATFTTFAPSPSLGPCPNDSLRTGPSSRLPDCRAYEQASPANKDGNDIEGDPYHVKAALGGDGVTFFNHGGIPGGAGAQNFPLAIAQRGTSDWVTTGLYPPPTLGPVAGVRGWTPDLAYSLSSVGVPGNFQIVSRRSSDGAITPIASSMPTQNLALAGASADDSQIYFESTNQLTPGATQGSINLYHWNASTDTLSLAGLLPDAACGSPPCAPPDGSFAGSYDWWEGTNPSGLSQGGASQGYYTQDEHAVSSSGDRLFFTQATTGRIYLRQGLTGPAPTTVPVSDSRASSPDPNGPKPAIFMAATASGSTAYFTSCQKLTDDSTARSTADNRCDGSGQGQDLYAYDAAGGGLTDLTLDGSDPLGADVKGVLGLGGPDSDPYVYFAANGDLDGSGPATLGDCQGAPNHLLGNCSIYLWHAGAITFVARLRFDNSSSGPVQNWQPLGAEEAATGFGQRTGRVSADGRTLLFQFDELYRFHVGDPGLDCVSCIPTGALPEGGFGLRSKETLIALPKVVASLGRNLSADGSRVFFESDEKLIASDTNGDAGCPPVTKGADGSRRTCQDVYEWEAQGSGSCTSAVLDGGCLYLISSGTSSLPSFFADASLSGNDVFFYTRDPLVSQDQDQVVDVYDARVGGGLASQHASSPPGCSGDACQGSATPAPVLPTAATVTFAGSGNATPGTQRVAPKGVSVTKPKPVAGPAAKLRVTAPAAGLISVASASIRQATKKVTKAGTYTIVITLTAKAKRTLKKTLALKVTVRVAFNAATGSASATTVSLTFKQPKPKRSRSSRARTATTLRRAGR